MDRLAVKIPLKSPCISIHEIGGKFLLHETNYGHRIRVNYIVIRLLDLVDGKSNIDYIRKQMLPYGSFTNDEIHHLLYKTLGKFGFITDEGVEVSKINKPEYLKMSLTLLSEKKVSCIAEHLKWLFSKKSFFFIFPLMALTLLYVQYNNFGKVRYFFETMALKEWLGLIMFAGANLFLHEFGHASSCKAFGARPGGIGFGFYLLSPVMYADVSDVWKLPIKERIIVSLSGMYMEMMLGIILLAVHILTKDTFFLTLSSVSLLSLFTNLNPFLKYDGYWLLTDITGCHNLRKQSNHNLGNLLKSRGKREGINIYLALYAAVANIMIVAFVLSVLVIDSNGLIDFPKNLLQIMTTLFGTGKQFSVKEIYPLLVPAIFYYILIKLCVSNAAKLIKNIYRK